MWAQKCKEHALHPKVSSHSRQKTKDKKPWFTSSKASQNETTFNGSSGQYIESWVGFIYIWSSEFAQLQPQLPSRMVAQMVTQIV